MDQDVLPFTAVQPGATRRIAFPLHTHTVNARHVGAMLEALLDSMTEQIRVNRGVSDGDVLQALCMALAIRMHMVEAPSAAVRAMVAATLEQADDAVGESIAQPSGNA
jgi:hypothetical protein